MNRIVAFVVSFLLLLAVAPATKAAPADTCIYFVNVYPGNEVYELEGHSAIVAEIAGRRPIAFNYGVFDFDKPNFVWRFVKGETDYRAVPYPADIFFNEYQHEGRRVVMHRLNLDSDGKRRLMDMLMDNVRPENATYRYNYVLNNCATRPLAVVERAYGDSIIFGPAPFEANSSLPLTFRNVMRNYHRNYPWYQFGIDLALGPGIDRPITSRMATFAPAELDRMLDNATVGGKPLIDQTIVAIDTAPDAVPDGPTPWFLTPLFVCWMVFAVCLYATVRNLRRCTFMPALDFVLFAIFGIAGCLLTFLIFVSTHEATSPNWLYVWLNPLCLLFPILMWSKRGRNVLFYYCSINAMAVTAILVAWPWIPQSANAAFFPLMMADILRSATFAINYRRKCQLRNL